MAYLKDTIPCPVCVQSTVNGRIWLGGTDWLECPQCDGSGKIERITERVQARIQERFLPLQGGGLSKSTRVILPHGGSFVSGGTQKAIISE